MHFLVPNSDSSLCFIRVADLPAHLGGLSWFAPYLDAPTATATVGEWRSALARRAPGTTIVLVGDARVQWELLMQALIPFDDHDDIGFRSPTVEYVKHGTSAPVLLLYVRGVLVTVAHYRFAERDGLEMRLV